MQIYICIIKKVIIITYMIPIYTRQKVLNLIRQGSPTSARQIASKLDMTEANVRHHLAVLDRDGLINVQGKLKRNGRGRPEKLFSLNERLRGDNLTLLSDGLLDLLLDNRSGQELEKILRSLGQKIKSKLNIIDRSRLLASRLPLLIDNLSTNHYQARWEAGAEGPRVLFGRCPYASVIRSHPELCRMDQYLLEDLAGVSAKQTAKIGEQRSLVCRFQLKELG